METITGPAQKKLIKRYLDWDKVEERLNRYEHIKALYPLKKLKRCLDQGPYYCHYLAWRLGTWEGEDWFKFFDDLIKTGSRLNGWKNKNRTLAGSDFANFWGFVWELQVAKFIVTHISKNCEWMNAGPDFRVNINDGMPFYVECTTYRKSFGVEEFIGDLFSKICPQIKVAHTPFIEFFLPKNEKIEQFLDALFAPYLEDSFLDDKIKEADRISPLILPIHNGTPNFYVYLESDKAQEYNLDQPWSTTGNAEPYLKDAIIKAVKDKTDNNSNNLMGHHPNLLAINFLIGNEYEKAISCAHEPIDPLIRCGLSEINNLSGVIDSIFLTSCGIDQIPSFTMNNSFLYTTSTLQVTTISSKNQRDFNNESRRHYHLQPGPKLVFIPYRNNLRVMIVPGIEQGYGFVEGIDTSVQRDEEERP